MFHIYMHIHTRYDSTGVHIQSNLLRLLDSCGLVSGGQSCGGGNLSCVERLLMTTLTSFEMSVWFSGFCSSWLGSESNSQVFDCLNSWLMLGESTPLLSSFEALIICRWSTHLHMCILVEELTMTPWIPPLWVMLSAPELLCLQIERLLAGAYVFCG